MPRRTSPTLTEALAEYIEVRSTYLAPTTLANDRSVLTVFIRGIGADTQAHELSARKAELYFAGEAKRQMESSYNKTRSRVAQFVQFLMARRWLDSDPLTMIRPRRVTKTVHLRLSVAEMLALPSHTRTERDKAFILLATNTALRAQDMTSLRVRDVDLQGGWLNVMISKTKREDVMPISTELDAALRQWFIDYEADAGPLQGEWFLFPQREPGHGRFIQEKGKLGGTYQFHQYGSLLPTKQMKNPADIVQRALGDAGIKFQKGEGCHTLRRSVARAFFDARVTEGYDGALRATSALLHHANSAITEHYLGLSTEKLGRDKALRGKPFLTAMIDLENVTPIRATSV